MRTQAPTARFRRELLPVARSFYERELGELRRPDSRGNARPKNGCPFHPSESNLSFSVDLTGGLWYCFACGEGGDMILFLMKRYHLNFTDATKRLGCWDDAGLQIGAVVIRGPSSLAPYLVLDFDIEGAHYSAAVRDEPRNYADKIRRFYREASDRLTELGRGDTESYIGELEAGWARVACALDELREMGTV